VVQLACAHFIALGTSWLLDGLEVTLTGSLSGILGAKMGCLSRIRR